MSVQTVAEDVQLLTGRPTHRINQYVIGDVLLDSGVQGSARRLVADLAGRAISAHALTHGHPDHYGSSRRVAERLGVPFWCPDGDADAVQARRLPHADHPVSRAMMRMPQPAPPPIARRLREGDEVGGFRVLDTPGHSPGHVAYWREDDRVLIAGDVLFNLNIVTGKVGLREPPALLTVDPARNRDAIARVAELEPLIVLFGHGPPLREPEKLQAFAATLAV